MMPEHTFWESDSQTARWKTAVVTQTGHVVARRCTAKNIQKGDIGLQVRADIKADDITPAQRAAAILTFQAMSTQLLTDLGEEREEQLFKPGQVIAIIDKETFEPDYAMFVREKGEGLVVKRYNNAYKLVTSLISTSGIEVDEVPEYFGEKGLILTLVIESGTGNAAQYVDLLADKDQDELEQIALRVHDESIAKKAVQKIKDEKSLARIAIHRKYGDKAQRDAIYRISDQEVLCEIVMLRQGIAEIDIPGIKVRAFRSCLDALERIDNQEILKTLFIEHENDVIRLKALEKITDQKFLADFLCSDSNVLHSGGEGGDARVIAARNLTDPELIKKAFQHLQSLGDEARSARRCLAASITDEEFIFQVFDEEDDYVREALLSYCTDVDFLTQVAKNKEFGRFVRRTAIDNLGEDEEIDLLVDIAKDVEEDQEIRIYAIESIYPEEPLQNLLNELKDKEESAILRAIEYAIDELKNTPPA